MKRFLVPLVLLTLAACSQAPDLAEVPLSTAAITTTKKLYTPSDKNIANPERGFYHAKEGDCNKTPFDVTKLVNTYRKNEMVTLVRCVFYLPKTSDISAQVPFFRDQAARLREAGLKMVLRFAYTKSHEGDDVPVARVLEHLTQLTQVLRDNSDVIAVVESGFVGAYGEGYFTDNFGDAGVVSSTDWKHRRAVVDKLLSILPSDPHPYFARTVLVRTPKMKREMYFEDPDGTTEVEDAIAVSSANAYKGTPVARIGHHNDCFLYNATDQGTFHWDPVKRETEKTYLADDTKYVPMGGEACDTPTYKNPLRSDCGTLALPRKDQESHALAELRDFHYSYLNLDWGQGILQSWRDGGCMETVKQKLGYRLELVRSEFPTSVTPGDKFTATIVIRNTGWAAPINPRPVYIGLRRKDGLLFTTWQFTDPFSAPLKVKQWHPSSGEITLTQNFTTQPSLPVGDYKLLFYLPDGYSSLADNPAYAIQMANVGTWEEHPVKPGEYTGWNDLQQVLRVR